jgi:hypothetical protein
MKTGEDLETLRAQGGLRAVQRAVRIRVHAGASQDAHASEFAAGAAPRL